MDQTVVVDNPNHQISMKHTKICTTRFRAKVAVSITAEKIFANLTTESILNQQKQGKVSESSCHQNKDPVILLKMRRH